MNRKLVVSNLQEGIIQERLKRRGFVTLHEFSFFNARINRRNFLAEEERIHTEKYIETKSDLFR